MDFFYLFYDYNNKTMLKKFVESKNLFQKILGHMMSDVAQIKLSLFTWKQGWQHPIK